MRRHRLARYAVPAVAVLIVVAAVGPASAKGPFEVRITGPGLAREIVVRSEMHVSQRPVGTASQRDALFDLIDGGQIRDELTQSVIRTRAAHRVPTGDLGARYRLRWTLPGVREPNWTEPFLVQDVYLKPDVGPLFFTPPGQLMGGGITTVGGWTRGRVSLMQAFDDIGVPMPVAGAPPRCTRQ